MAIDKGQILTYFSHCDGHGRGRLLHEAAYYLMRMVFMSRDFDSLDELTVFLDNPDNLRPWLSNETDRVVLSAGLRDGLQDMLTGKSRAASDANKGFCCGI